MLYINTFTHLEVDIDKKEHVTDFKAILSTPESFYIMANKRFGKFGMFLFEIKYDAPEDPCEYYMSLNSNMAISNCDMSLIKKTNEMVVSYTSIGANTYNIMVFDLKVRRIKFNFEIYSLSEDRTMGFLLATNDFLIMNQQGI